MAATATPVITEQLLLGPISAHAFNKDRSQVAVCPNNNEVHVYARGSAGWTLAQVLGEHDKLVTGIDWAPESNRIVTCSQDRNAYVWNLNPASGQWEPTLVLLRINRAATFVRWSPKENKFAVASGAKTIAVCYFEQENNWWVSKQIKKPISSTVTSVDWHPSNLLLAAGSTDMKARIFAAYVKDVDEKASGAPWIEGRLTFGQVVAEYDNGRMGWVHSVAFSPSGGQLAWSGHGSDVCVVDGATKQASWIKTANLPLLSLIFASEDSIIAAGHDCYPALIRKSGANWEYVDKLDGGDSKKAASTGSTAMNMFRQMDSRAQAAAPAESLPSVHQNTITSVRKFESSPAGDVSKFSTTGVDGLLVVWQL
ncbi:WD40-repeat-containing domain protein [Hyaloraphidium curvatum]|nr:WD40-repeat-containing domain protein [Hyaloraphidium curvatum]